MLQPLAIPEGCQPMLFRKEVALSVPAFSIVTHRNKEFSNLVPEISLNRDLPVLGRAAYSALDLQSPAEFLQIVLAALEACDQGDLLSGPAPAVNGDPEMLGGRCKSLLDSLLRLLLSEIRICRINHSETLLPIVLSHIDA